MPADLYIPPEALSVFLDAFEGPLDLLLYLIRKHSLDILDIPMAELTRQYMEYVEMMRTHAARARRRVPADGRAADRDQVAHAAAAARGARTRARPEDPRAELVRRLLEYERMKKAPRRSLGEAPVAGRDFSRGRGVRRAGGGRAPAGRAGGGPLGGLALDPRAREDDPAPQDHARAALRARAHEPHPARLSRPAPSSSSRSLFEPEQGVPVLVVSFLALLELARESLIDLTQQSPFDPIYVKLKSERATAHDRMSHERTDQSRMLPAEAPEQEDPPAAERASSPRPRPREARARGGAALLHRAAHRRSS